MSEASTGRDHLLIRFMYYICTGNGEPHTQCGDRLTPLENALAALRSLEPLCSDRVTELVHTVAFLIKQQVISAYCNFS